MILDTETFLTVRSLLRTDGSLHLNPPVQHYYHFWGEVVLGAWRVYSTLALSKETTALDRLPFPSRLIVPVRPAVALLCML